MTKLFEGKVAVITGGSSGIGRAAAIAFAAEGEETTRQIQAQGGEAIFVATDVTRARPDTDSWDAAVRFFGYCSWNPCPGN